MSELTKTQQDEILAHLRRRKTVTPVEALVVYGVYRLSDVIFRLRHRGYRIATTMKRDDKGRRYAEYHLLAHDPVRNLAAA